MNSSITAARTAFRATLLTGVSAAALFAATSADAQGVVKPPFVSGDAYSSSSNDNPKGANLTVITTPGVTASTTPQVLVTTSTLTPIANGTTGVLNANGTPVHSTYAQEIAAGAAATTGTAGSGVANYVIVDSTGALANPAGLTASQLAGLSPLPTTPTTYSWALATSKDPTAAVAKWVAATYDHNKAFTSVAYAQPNSSGQKWYVVDANGNAVPLSTFGPYFAGLTSTQQNALNTAANIGNITSFNANLAADGSQFKVVAGNTVDPTLAASTNYTYQALQSSPQGQGNGTVRTNQGANASTTSYAGGIVYANSAGSSTAIGPDGITGTGWTLTIKNPSGTSSTVITNGNFTSTETTGANAGTTNIDGSYVHISTPVGASSNDVFLTGNGMTFNNTAGVNTITLSTSTGNIATVGSLSVGGVTNLNGGANVTGNAVFNGTGANAGTTTVINGATATFNGTALTGATAVSGGSVTINGGSGNSNQGGNISTLQVAGISGTGNPGALTVSGGAVVNNGLEVNNGLRVTGPSQGQGAQTIDMGGNRIQDVGTPIFGTDAANKAYVDRGLNRAYEGTAIALAISQPVFGPGQSFAIRAGWGGYENENAFGLSAAGIIGRDWFWGGSTVALDGGVGWGSSNSVAGKVGLTIGFGAGPAPISAAYVPMK